MMPIPQALVLSPLSGPMSALSQALRLNESPMYQWRKYLSWGLPLLGGFLVLMVVLAMLARRHKKN